MKHTFSRYYFPARTIAGSLSVTPVRPSVRTLTSVSTSHQRRPLSKLNSFDRNFMKLGHIVKYLMSSSSSIMVHIAPCLQELLPFVNENSQFFMVSSLFYEVWSRL